MPDRADSCLPRLEDPRDVPSGHDAASTIAGSSPLNYSVTGDQKAPLGAALVRSIECDCATCRGAPALTITSDFEGLVLSGLEAVPFYPDALRRLNEFARCRDIEEVLFVDDEDDLAKETFFTFAAGDVDPGCKLWAAIIAFVLSLADRSWWAELLTERIQASEDFAHLAPTRSQGS
jgi:hypothetical protein